VLEGSNLVILVDRDGVLNVDRVDSVRSLADLEVEAGAVEGCRRLHAAGYRLAVVTNQSAVGRGQMTRPTLDAVNAALDERLGHLIDGWFVCDHGPGDGCRCRKPGTLLLEQAQARYGFDPAATWFVADAPRDVEAARAYGCRPAIVRTGKGAATAAGYPDVPAFRDLAEFAERLLTDPVMSPIS
jgi:D-glycero-D-manno-heptose 1,7-bisphosphate phosphatase